MSFINLLREYGYSEAMLPFIQEALDFSEGILSKHQRLSGDSYFDHNLKVAETLVKNRADPDTIVTGILHGILKHVDVKLIEKHFGEEIVELLQGVNEVKELKSKNKQLDAESLRKVILVTIKDIRIMMVFLAVKLDNMRTLNVFSSEEQLRYSKDVLDFYAPLAYRLGMENMRVALEDIAFRTVNPETYREIAEYLHDSREDREESIKDAIASIKKMAGESKILKIKGRPKHIFSIYKKIVNRGVPLNEQFDLLGIRIIVQEINECYDLLARLHEEFDPVPGKLKDYIAHPKPNFYRSIHTAVYLRKGQVLELQIRTKEMDEYAEEGIAAHWRYKGVKSDELFEKKISWLRGILDLQQEGSAKEFLEAAKVDLFGDKIHCYTPKGDVKELPRDASLLDFAFLVHEEVGNRCVGGKVNGKFVPIKHTLQQGDVIEIITNKNQRPRRSWLKLVKSAKNRQKIRKSLKEHENLPATFYRTVKPLMEEEQGVLVESSEFPRALCMLAKCCLPIPAEEICGILTKRHLISVHQVKCRFASKEVNRWIPVQWKNVFTQKIKFYVNAVERSGLLADLLHTIIQAGFVVKEAKAKLIGQGGVECSFMVVPRDLEELKLLIARVLKVKGVGKIYFE